MTDIIAIAKAAKEIANMGLHRKFMFGETPQCSEGSFSVNATNVVILADAVLAMSERIEKLRSALETIACVFDSEVADDALKADDEAVK